MQRIILLLIAILCCLSTTYAQSIIKPKADEQGKWGYCQGDTWVITPRYELAKEFSEDMAAVRLNGKWAYINRVGEVVIPFQFDEVYSFAEGKAAVKKMDKWGFINKSGSSVIPYRFDFAVQYSEGLAAVKIYDKWGFIDHNGQCKIPYKYNSAKSFTDGLANVTYNDKVGYIDIDGKWYESKSEYVPNFTNYATTYIDKRIKEWQKKGKYEKSIDWQKRVNDETRAQKVTELTREAEGEYIKEYSKRITFTQRLAEYDADNETFLIKDEKFGDLLVAVSILDAPRFEEEFYTMKRTARYFIENDKIGLAEMSFYSSTNNKFTYSNQASLDYTINNIDYQFTPIEVDQYAITRIDRGEQNIRQNQLYSSHKSDVDINIPISKKVNDKTFAIIIANETYRYESSVEYALNDGKTMLDYCKNTLGIPDDHIYFEKDATSLVIGKALEWIRLVDETNNVERVIFYYAGHGIPNLTTGEAYLLPMDGSSGDTKSAFPLSKLYEELGELASQSVVVMLDACFSGATRDGGMLKEARGVRVAPRPSMPKGNTVVLSATTGEEVAIPLNDKKHGMFTYYLLKKLQDTQGECSLRELYEYVNNEVKSRSVIMKHEPQTPTIIPSNMMREKWQNLKLK